jgi:aryl carrier-like protein
MERMPLILNGKMDRKALPFPERDSFVREEYEAPRGEIEGKLATLWKELLHVNSVSRSDNFFELGGHSLLAVRLASRIRNCLGADVGIADLLLKPCLSSQAKLIAERQLEVLEL